MGGTTTVTVLAASVLAATITAAGPAAAADPVPLVYTTLSQTADGDTTTTVDSIGYDATGHRRLVAAALVAGSGPEVVGPATTYSADHTRVAWGEADWTSTGVTYAVEVRTLATRTVATFPVPAGEALDTGGSYPQWFADGSRLALVLTSGSASTISTLDLATGTFTPVTSLADDQVASLAVSSDGTIGFSSGAGVGVLVGARGPVRYLHRSSGPDESCTTVRTRPGSKREFTYLCSTFGATGQQLVRSQVPSGAVHTLYTADTSTTSTAPITYLDGFAWAPSGTSLALATTTVRSVDEATCTNAMTSALSTVRSNGAGRRTLQTEPTITAQTCKGNGWGDVDTVVWSADEQTIVFLHATRFLGPMSAYAVRPAAPQTQTELAKRVIDLSS